MTSPWKIWRGGLMPEAQAGDESGWAPLPNFQALVNNLRRRDGRAGGGVMTENGNRKRRRVTLQNHCSQAEACCCSLVIMYQLSGIV